MKRNSKIDVFCLIDTSGSMVGEPIESIKIGITETLNKLCADHRTKGRIRISIHTYNSKFYENHQLELAEILLLKFNNIGNAEGLTLSGLAIENTLTKIKETVNGYSKKDILTKKPLFFHITDGCPSDIQFYNEITQLINRKEIHTIGCGIGNTADLKFLKLFSNKVIYLNNNDSESIIQFSKLMSEIILFHLFSDNDDLDFTAILNPIHPNNPTLTDRIKIL